MSDVIISVEGLGKKYAISHQGQRSAYRYKTFREALTQGAAGLVTRWSPRRREAARAATREDFWALRNVSFDLERGKVLGIIGRNGAGKSTLLKILSRITEPSEGRVTLRGRVASLLEVGTGFHPELTGRENIFLNGSILGMTRVEIKRKFDEIVAFAGVEKFLDTPVKRYSSGMYVRLAFAVAAHLEPEILVVDEVLAVGDSEFQKKCLGKMRDVTQGEGRTVLFVSHNMALIRSLCNAGLLLNNGRVLIGGSVESAAAAYTELASTSTQNDHTAVVPPPSNKCDVWMQSVSVLRNGVPGTHIELGDRISLHVRFKSQTPITRPLLGYLIRSDRGENAVNANNYFLPSPDYDEPVTSGSILCDLGELPLMAGSYSVSFWLCRHPNEQHHVEDVLYFTVEDKDIWGTGHLPTKSLSCLWWPTHFTFSTQEQHELATS